MAYTVSESLCPQNHRYPIIRVCASNAIVQDGYGLPMVDKSKCTECGKCAKYCSTGAVNKTN